MKRRLTSWLLTLAMLLSLVPAMGVTASAAETGSGSGTADDPYVVTTYEELQTAMQKAGGSYVRLGADIDTTSMNGDMGIGFKGQIVVNSNVALDLYSHKVTLMKRGDTERSGLIDVRRGSLTIEDSEGGGELNGKNMLTSKRLYLIECYDGAKVTVNSGKLSMWSAATASDANAVIKNSGTVEINGGTLAISSGKNYDEDLYLAQQDCALSMTSLDGSSVVINGGTFKGRVLLYAHAKSEGKAGSVINGGTFEKSVYVQKDRTKTGDVPLDVSIRGGTYRYTPGYRTNNEGKPVSDPQNIFQFATKGFLNGDSPYYDEAPYFHGTDPEDGRLDTYDLTAFRSIFPTNAILVAKGQSYTHRDYRDGSETEVQLVDKLFTGADGNTEWARLMNSEYQTIDVVSDIQLEDATLKVGDTTVPDNGGNVTTGYKAITITGKVNKQIAQLVQDGKIDLGFGLNVVKTTNPMEYLTTTAATLSTESNSDGRLNVTVTLPSAQLAKADYSVRLDLFPKKPGTTTTPVGGGLLPCGWKLSADDANKPVTINYNNNGGSGSMASQQVMSGKQPYTLPNCTFTAPTGKVFKGWSTTQDGTGLLSDGKLPLTEVGSSVTVYAIWGVPTGMEIDKVTLSVKNYSQRQSTDDFRVTDRTPNKEMSFKGFWIYEGLSKKDGDLVKTYDKTKDYSVVYEFEAALGYQFAENISVDDVSANDGEVWQVNRLKEGKILQVCVNYRSGDSIKGMWLKVKEPLAGDSAQDDAYEIRSTDGRYTVEYTNWYQGEFTNNGQISGAPFTGNFEAGEQYTCAFRVLPSSGYKVAHGYTNGLYLNGAQVTNCTELNPTGDDAKGYYGLYTFTVMDTSDKISKVGIQVKPAADRADISTDFGPRSFTPASRMELRVYQIYEGLNQTGGDRPTAYDPAKDYSAIYEFTAGGSYSFAEGISTADVTINDGQVWQVKRLNEGKNLLIYVNFPSGDEIIKGMRLKVKEPTAGASSVDTAYQISSTDSRYKVDYTDWYQGEFTDNSQLGVDKFAGKFEAGQKYTCAFRVKANAGYKVAHGFTSALYLNEAQVTNCTELVSTGDNAEGYYGLYTFTAVDAPDTISKVTIQVMPKAQRTQLNDFRCQDYTPAGSMGSPFFVVREGLNTDGSGSTLTTYDKNKDYSVVYEFPINSGCTIAADISTADVTINDGKVWQVKSDSTGEHLLVYVNFPAASAAGQVVKTVTIQVKPKDERNTLNDFACQSYTPTDSMGSPFFVVREGLNTDGSGSTPAAYDKNQDYSVVYEFPINSGCTIAEDISTSDVTINDGQVWKVSSDGKGEHLLVYVNFPVTGPTPETKTIEKIHLDFKPYSGRKTIGDLNPITQNPGTDKMELAIKYFYEGDTAGPSSLAENEKYESSKNYTAALQYNCKNDVTIAKGFTKEDITISNGTVNQIVRNDKYVIIVVNFPKDPTTDPNYVTEAAVQVAAVAGEIPSINGITVTSSNADKIKKALVLWSNTSTPFVAGQEYSTTVYLEPKEGVTFADDMKLNVNGKVVDLAKKDPNGSVQFLVKITATGSTHTHSYGTEWKYDGTNHWHECECGDKANIAAHSASEWIVDTAATETADGAKHKECTVCKKVLETATIPATGSTHTHSYGTEWKYDDTNHWHECECGDKADIAAHSASEWIVDTAATKTADGAKHKECTVCKKVLETATIPATGSGSTGGGGGGSSVTTYAITVKSAKNGDVTASRKSASKGTTVTLTVDPDKGYVLDTLTVLDSKDKEIKLTEKNGKYTFTMPASKVTVAATFKASAPTGKNPFIDVPAGSYYEDAVIWAVDKGITTGTSATTFNPNGICTRAQAVTFLWRAAGSPAAKSAVMPFADVKAGSYYYDAVLWAVEQGITKGTSDTMFSPDATCTRAQIVTFLWRANGSPAVSGNSAFTDVAADAYYAAAVTWAEKNDVTGGIGNGLFGSNNNCTRAQIVTFLYRAMK